MTPITAVGVVIPAHNEEALIGDCLTAVRRAAGHPGCAGLEIRVLVVLDQCTDETADRCAALGVQTVSVSFTNVGRARAAGIAAVVASAEASWWLACTDADTRVAPDWLAAQLRFAHAGTDAVFGVVDVDDWSAHPPQTRSAFHRLYRGTRRDERAPHVHVHGASMGFRHEAYVQVGGMPELAVGEDQVLSDRMSDEPGMQVVRTTAVRATTSARTDPRAGGGFGDLLRALPHAVSEPEPAPAPAVR